MKDSIRKTTDGSKILQGVHIYINICTYSMYNNMEEEKRLEEGRRKRKTSKAWKKKELIIAKTLESIYMKKNYVQ